VLRSRSYVFSNLHDDFLVFSLFFHGKNRRAKWRIGFFLFCFYCVVKVFSWRSCSWRASGNRVSASCLQLGMMYQEGKGTKQDMAQAAQLYKKGCDGIGGEWAACGLYAEYQIGIEEMQEAALYYEKACRLGDWARLGTTDEKVGDIVNHLCEASESLKSFRPKESAAQRLLRDAARP